MTTVGYGPLYRIDGPLPEPPLFGLLQAAQAPAAGVRIIPDVAPDGFERWLNGVEVYPYPATGGGAFRTCAPGSDQGSKGFGDDDPARPQFDVITVYFAESCTSYRVWDQDRYRARAVAALEAVQSSLVAQEFMRGTLTGEFPHLSDGNSTFPHGDTVTSIANGVSILEGEIAKSGRLGVIHMSPMAAALAGGGHLLRDTTTGVLRTYNGTPVIPDAGYESGATPKGGHAAAGATEEWMYATGPIEVRRSETFVLPESVDQALDRGLGATNDRPNSITYRAERFYLIDWDTAVHAAVLVDRCKTTC